MSELDEKQEEAPSVKGTLDEQGVDVSGGSVAGQAMEDGSVDGARRRLIVLNAELTRRTTRRHMGRAFGVVTFLVVGSFFGSIIACYLPISEEIANYLAIFFVFMLVALVPLSVLAGFWHLWSYRKLRRFFTAEERKKGVFRLEDERRTDQDLEGEKLRIVSGLGSAFDGARHGVGALSLPSDDEEKKGHLTLDGE